MRSFQALTGFETCTPIFPGVRLGGADCRHLPDPQRAGVQFVCRQEPIIPAEARLAVDPGSHHQFLYGIGVPEASGAVVAPGGQEVSGVTEADIDDLALMPQEHALEPGGGIPEVDPQAARDGKELPAGKPGDSPGCVAVREVPDDLAAPEVQELYLAVNAARDGKDRFARVEGVAERSGTDRVGLRAFAFR